MRKFLSPFCLYFAGFCYITAIVALVCNRFDWFGILFFTGLPALMLGLLIDVGHIEE